MRTLDHYLDTIDDTDTIGREYVARAIFVAREGPAELSDPKPSDLRPIIEDLPDTVSADEAIRLVCASALRRAADDDSPGSTIRTVREALGMSRTEMGERLGIPTQGRQCGTLRKWELRERSPDWKGRGKLRSLADELEDTDG